MNRVTKYGTGNLGVVVNGIRILLTVADDQAETAAKLAEAIAALGPEGIASVTPQTPTATPERPAAPPKRFAVGQPVWCTVSAIRGWMTVTAVHADGRIKVNGGRVWCPLHNFEAERPSWQAAS